MEGHDVLAIARRDRDRLRDEIDRLRELLATSTDELEAIERFLERYDRYQAHIVPAADPRPPLERSADEDRTHTFTLDEPPVALSDAEPATEANPTPLAPPLLVTDHAAGDPQGPEHPTHPVVAPDDAAAAELPTAGLPTIALPFEEFVAAIQAAQPKPEPTPDPLPASAEVAGAPTLNDPVPQHVDSAGSTDQTDRPVAAALPEVSVPANAPSESPPAGTGRSPLERLFAHTERTRPSRPSLQAAPPFVPAAPANSDEPHAESPPPPFDACFILEEAHGARRIAVPPAPFTIGSDQSCDLVLPASYGVAPRHAVATLLEDGGVLLRVIAPGAPTTVNSQRTNWATLEHDDLLSLGAFTLRLAVTPTDAVRAATDPESHDARQAG